MAFIDTIAPPEASGETLEMYQQLQTGDGSVPNYARIFSHRPRLMEAWSVLQSTLRKTIEPRRYELATLAAARAIGSSYCSLAYGKKLLNKYFSQEDLLSIAEDERSTVLTETEVLVMKLAQKTAVSSSSVNRDDIQALRDQGLADEEIFDVVATAAARCFFAKIVDALGALPDATFSELPEPILEKLVVGRQIEVVEQNAQ